MASRRILLLGVILAAASVGGYFLWRSPMAEPITGVIRATQIDIAPEVGGQLASVNVTKDAHVRAGDVVAKLSAHDLIAAVSQARAALNAATADRNNVYAGVRAEQIASLAAETAKAKSKLDYVQTQLTRVTTLVAMFVR
jgi:HlyD family secretion protein